jgi:hypothetical protein
MGILLECSPAKQSFAVFFKNGTAERKRQTFPGENSVRKRPIYDKYKILLPPLRIKLELIENFVKAVNEYDKGVEYVFERKISETQ